MIRLLPILLLVSCAQTPPVTVTAPDGTTMQIGKATAIGGRVGAVAQARDGTRAAVYGNSEEGARELAKTARFGIGTAGAMGIARDLGSAFSGAYRQSQVTERTAIRSQEAVETARLGAQTPLP